MARSKKSAAKSSVEKEPAKLNAEEIVQQERERIKTLLAQFVNSRGHMIQRHLNMVKENTGEIQGEDVVYALNLFTRELKHVI